MCKFLLVLAIIATAHTLPIEQNDDVAIPAASEIDASKLNPYSAKPEDQIVIDPVPLPKPIDSEATHSFEPEHSDPDSIPPSPLNPESGNQEKPVAPEPIVTEPIASKPVINEPIPLEPVVKEPIAPEPIVPEPIGSEQILPKPINGPASEFHKPEELIDHAPEHPIADISKPDETVPHVIPDKQGESDEKDLEAAIDEFFSFLNLTDSEEMEDVVLGAIILELFEGLDEVLTALEQMEALTGQKEDAEILRKHINDPFLRTAFEKKLPKQPISVNNEELKQNKENEDESPAVACKAERGLPGICVPYYLCATTNENCENVIPTDVDSSTCPTVTEVCCSSENLQLGTGAGLRKC